MKTISTHSLKKYTNWDTLVCLSFWRKCVHFSIFEWWKCQMDFLDIIVNFIIQKMKSKHTSLKKYTNWDNLVWNERKYFSHISGLEFLKTHHCALCFKSVVILLLLLLACAIYGIYLWSLLHSAAQKTMPVAFFWGGVCHIFRNCNKIALVFEEWWYIQIQAHIEGINIGLTIWMLSRKNVFLNQKKVCCQYLH